MRNTVLFGPVIQTMFFFAAAGIVVLEVFYIMLFLMVVAQQYFYERDNPGLKVFDTKMYSVGALPQQVVAGALIGVAIGAPLIAFGHPAVVHVDEWVKQTFFVGFVETYLLVVFVETTYVGRFHAGPFIWPFFFASLHPAVRTVWMAGRFTWASLVAFAYAASFGVLFYSLYEARNRLSERRSRWFGAVTSWTTHVTVNMIVITFALSIMGTVMLPL